MEVRSKLEKLAALLSQASDDRCENVGGYPDVITVRQDCIVVATVDDDGAPELRVYEKADAENWYDRAMEYKRENGCNDAGELLGETEP